MKTPVYKRELSHSYLILDQIPEEGAEKYQYRMILRNRIPGLLSCSERFIEGKPCLYYDISSRQSLSQMYDSVKIGYEEIRSIIDNLAQVQGGMAEYLLEERCLMLHPDYIYMDLETEQLFFLYDPFGEEGEGSGYLAVAEFFLEHVDHREEKAADAAYQFYKLSKGDSFTIESFRALLEKEEPDGSYEAAAENRGVYYGAAAENGGIYYETGTEKKGMYFYEEAAPYEYQKVVEDQGRARSRPTGAGPAGYRQEGYRQEDPGPSGRRSGSLERAGYGPEGDGAVRYRPEGGGAARYRPEGPGPMRYRPEEEEQREWGEEMADSRKKSGTGHRGRYLAGLIGTSLGFLLLCVIIWYMQPSGTQKLLWFGGLAADGLLLLVCLWKVITPGKEKAKEAVLAEREEFQTSEESAEQYQQYQEYPEYGLDGPTVFIGSGKGADIKDGWGGPIPRLVEEGGEGREYFLDKLPVIVGKLRSRVQLLLPDASVSRVHARFVEKEGETALMDLNSTNGTYINEIRLEQGETVILEDGDEIRFGTVKMKFDKSGVK